MFCAVLGVVVEHFFFDRWVEREEGNLLNMLNVLVSSYIFGFETHSYPSVGAQPYDYPGGCFVYVMAYTHENGRLKNASFHIYFTT
jgi:hypothetical protein